MSTTLHSPEADPVAEADLATHEAKSVSQAHGTVKPADIDASTVGTGSTQVAAGNDSRFPSAGQKNALAGSSGTPGTGNEYLTKQDASVATAASVTTEATARAAQDALLVPLAQKNVAGGWAGLTSDRVVPPAYGGFPIFGVTQARFGAVGDGVTDDRAACLAAHVAAEVAGGTVHYEAGKTFLLDSVGPIPINPASARTGWLQITGGATIKIGPNMPASDRGFLKAGRTADDQTLARVIVEGFEVDGQKLAATSAEGLRGGNVFRASGVSAAQRLNFEDIIFRNIYSHGIAKPSTYGDGTGTFNNQTHIYMACYHADQTGAVNTIKRIRFENVRMESGVHGDFTGANVGSGTGATVYYEDIVHKNCTMDHLETHTTPTGSCFQVGSHAYGDRVVFENCEGRYSNDTAFEVNAAQSCIYKNCTARDPVNAGFYARDFHAAQDPLAKQWIIEGCRVTVDNIVPNNASIPSHGIQVGALPTDVWGLVAIRDYVYTNTTAMKYDGDAGGSSNTNQGHAISLAGSQVQTLKLENVVVRETGIAVDTTVRGGSFAPVSIRPRSTTTKMRLVIDGLHVKQAGSVAAAPNAWTYFGLIAQADAAGSGSDMSLDVRDLDIDFQIPSNSGYAWGIAALGATAGITTTLRGVLRRLYVNSAVASTGGSLGLRIGAMDRCTIDKVLLVEACNFSGIGTNNQEVTFSGVGSNAAAVVMRDCTLRATSTLGGAAPISVSVTGSPFTYQNLDMVRQEVRVTGGTVSDISHSRDNSTFGTIATATGERVLLEPGHAVKVTYTVAPTMTKVLQR